jgi:hypothetical protein
MLPLLAGAVRDRLLQQQVGLHQRGPGSSARGPGRVERGQGAGAGADLCAGKLLAAAHSQCSLHVPLYGTALHVSIVLPHDKACV